MTKCCIRFIGPDIVQCKALLSNWNSLYFYFLAWIIAFCFSILFIYQLCSLFIWTLFLSFSLCLSIWKATEVTEESITIFRELGVQLETRYFWGRRRFRFIEKEFIRSLLLNEGITAWHVVFYLAFVVREERKLTMVFEHLRPCLDDLLRIYQVIYQFLELE